MKSPAAYEVCFGECSCKKSITNAFAIQRREVCAIVCDMEGGEVELGAGEDRVLICWLFTRTGRMGDDDGAAHGRGEQLAP